MKKVCIKTIIRNKFWVEKMVKEKRCTNCKYFRESGSGKIYCGLFGKYDEIIHNLEMESCNYYKVKHET